MKIGNIVNSVMGMVDKVGGMSSHSTASKGVGLMESIGDLFSGGKPTGSEIGGVIGGFMETVGSLGQMGLGGQVNNLVDSLGLPDWIGDIAGGVADFATGNFVGAAANGMDALGDGVKALGKLSDKIGQSKTEGYAEASGQVSGMYNEGGSVDAHDVDHAEHTAQKTAESIETGRQACACYQAGDTVEAGRKTVESTRQSVAAEAAAHPDVSEADAQKADDTMAAIEDAFSTFALAANKDDALAHIKNEHGEEVASLVERFADKPAEDDSRGLLGILGGVGKTLASVVGKTVSAGAPEIFEGLINGQMDILSLIENGSPVVDDLQSMFLTATSGDTASKLGADKGASIRM
ncbi:MAG: hypothetical protein ACQEVA_15295 [Myxococcota bacterium]